MADPETERAEAGELRDEANRHDEVANKQDAANDAQADADRAAETV